MHKLIFVLTLSFSVYLTACGGGPTDATKAVEAANVELALTPYQIESVDFDQNPAYKGKIVEFSGTVTSVGSAKSGENKFGKYFVYVSCEQGANDPYAANINCYTPINYSNLEGKAVTVKGKLDYHINGILFDCVVTSE